MRRAPQLLQWEPHYWPPRLQSLRIKWFYLWNRSLHFLCVFTYYYIKNNFYVQLSCTSYNYALDSSVLFYSVPFVYYCKYGRFSPIGIMGIGQSINQWKMTYWISLIRNTRKTALSSVGWRANFFEMSLSLSEVTTSFCYEQMCLQKILQLEGSSKRLLCTKVLGRNRQHNNIIANIIYISTFRDRSR